MVFLGIALLTVAVLLALAEAHITTGGMIGGAACVALVSGATLLLLGLSASSLVVLSVAMVLALASVGGLLIAARSLLSVRRMRPRSGPEGMVGHLGVVRACEDSARVFIDGGLWRAQPSLLEAGAVLHEGDRVIVERVSGLTLSVRKAEEWELSR